MHGGRGIHEAINPTEARAHSRIRAVVAGVIVVVVVGGGGGGFLRSPSDSWSSVRRSN